MHKRSNWKYNYVHKDLYQFFFLKDENVIYKTQARGSTILPLVLNIDMGVHDGYTYFKITPTASMVGYKLGEFVRTRQSFRYGKK